MQAQDFLVSGAIWARTDEGGNGRRATILLVANQHLSDKAAKKFPPVVVYLDDRGRVNAVGIERFTETREFWDMDDRIVARAAALLAEEDEDDTPLAVVEDEPVAALAQAAPNANVITGVTRTGGTGDILSFGDEDDNDAMSDAVALAAQTYHQQPVTAAQHDAPAQVDTPVSPQDVADLPAPALDAVFISNAEAYPMLAPEVLEPAVVQYEQEPHVTEDGLILRHKVHVALSDTVTIDALNAAFNPEADVYYNAFKVNGIVVPWQSYLGAWPLIASHGYYALMVFTTRVGEAEVEDTEATPEVAQQNEERMLTALKEANAPQDLMDFLSDPVSLTQAAPPVEPQQPAQQPVQPLAVQAQQPTVMATPVQITAAPATTPTPQQPQIQAQQPTVMQGAFEAAGITTPQQAEVLDLVGRNTLNVTPAQ